MERRKFNEEIVPVSIPQRKGEPVIFAEDEEYKAVNFDRISTLPTVFKKEEGTVTAANASTLNDGASALILVSKEKMEELGLKPLAKSFLMLMQLRNLKTLQLHRLKHCQSLLKKQV
jgi:acetyl-CoA C-acetyltransferase